MKVTYTHTFTSMDYSVVSAIRTRSVISEHTRKDGKIYYNALDHHGMPCYFIIDERSILSVTPVKH